MKIILTGGGTAGHVTPNFALVPYLKAEGFEIYYVGSKDGMEKKLVEDMGISYYGICCGKLRRYVSTKNFTDVFQIIKGIFQANTILKKLKPNIVFSKGGFVSVPVVIAAKLNKIPVVIHESDMTVGLANKISMPMAKIVCTSFPQTAQNLKRAIVTGSPVRDELFLGNAERARKKLKQYFAHDLNVILVIGGSQGSKKINSIVRQIVSKLEFNIIHICGKGNLVDLNDKCFSKKNYAQFEYVTDELADYFALADIIVSRSGSNSIFEFLALKKPNLLIPLSKSSSRGDQILNADYFASRGFSKVLYEDDLSEKSLFDSINDLMKNKNHYIKSMSQAEFSNGCQKIVSQIKKYAKQ